MLADNASKKETVNRLLKKGILLSSELVSEFSDQEFEKLLVLISSINLNDFDNLTVLNRDIKLLLETIKDKKINWVELDRLKTSFEKSGKINNYLALLNSLKGEEQVKPVKATEKTSYSEEDKYPVAILDSYMGESQKRDTQDFVKYFNKRHKQIEKILKNRTELNNLISISRLKSKKDRDRVSIIGLITEKRTTKNKNIILTIEDTTGTINILANHNKQELFNLASESVLDEVVGVVGVNAENIVFAENILLPDIPTSKELKKCPEDVSAIFLSDLHIGSKKFLSEDFDKFLKWINGAAGSEKQKALASKVKYIFIVGDLVDGCGIYPGQEEELSIAEIVEQYEECAKLLKQIPQDKKLIICAGNHDALRISEPQPPLSKEFAAALYDLPNVVIVSNPATINIHKSDDFPGFDVLLYHGYSFDYFISEVDTIRNNGGYDRGDLVMKFLLQRRHLAPTHTSTLYIPETSKDPLVIEKIPDFFVSGHIHKSVVANYRNITTICGSCWQSKTSFQEKVGHNPEPGRVPIVNLQTREIKILKFSK